MSQHDRNFDDLYDRFEEKIYDTAKGDWRLTLLKEDLQFLQQGTPLTVWDVGCGQGQISQWFAENAHQLTLCDLSSKMIAAARKRFETAHLSAQFYHQSAQSLAVQMPDVDLLICHAVLEWLAKPLPSLLTLTNKIKTGGHLSLLFYNRNAMVYTNVLKGSWRLQPILDDSYMGQGNKLTPPNPQYPYDVISTLEQAGFSLLKQTGIRVFHDYMDKEVREQSDLDTLFALEARFCRQPTYRDMGRYIHLVMQKTTS
jgi:S-adenosylmethionine-dependent methyltransferase